MVKRSKNRLTRTGRVFGFEPGVVERTSLGGLRIKKEVTSRSGRFRTVRTEFAPKESNNTVLMRISLFDNASGLTAIDEVLIEEPNDLLTRAQEAMAFIGEQPQDLDPPREPIKSTRPKPIRDVGFSGMGGTTPSEVVRMLKEDDLRSTSPKRRREERARLQRLQSLNEEFLLSNPVLQEKLNELRKKLD